MSDTQISKEELNKALAAVKALVKEEDLSKGHSSKGTNTTKVETMSGESGSPQIHHTPSNSDPGSWAGSSGKDVSENGASDSIADNGTDYEHAKMVKAIIDRMQKGLPVSAEEKKMAKAALFGKEDKDEEKEEKDEAKKAMYKGEDKEDETKKSLSDRVSDNDTLKSALEVSDFLTEWSGELSKALEGVEARVSNKVIKNVESMISGLAESQAEYNSNLAKAIQPILAAMVSIGQRVEQVEASPARGAKSAVATGSLEKGGFKGESEETLTKSQVSNYLVEMFEKGNLDQGSVLRFDATGQISKDVLAQVHQRHTAGK